MDGIVQEEVVDRNEEVYVPPRDRVVFNQDPTLYTPTMKRGDMVRVGVPLMIDDDGVHLHATDFFWISRKLWEDLRDFQTTPPPPPNFPFPRDEAMRDTLRGDSVIWAAEMDRKIRLNPSRSHVWRVWVISSDWARDVEEVVVLGTPSLVEWSWFEINVGRPVLWGICRLVNFFRG